MLKNQPLKAIIHPTNVGNITMSNFYAALDDESEEDVENMYDESTNLLNSTKTGESSSTFTVAADDEVEEDNNNDGIVLTGAIDVSNTNLQSTLLFVIDEEANEGPNATLHVNEIVDEENVNDDVPNERVKRTNIPRVKITGTMASSMDPVTQSLPGSQSAPNVALKDKIRGCGKIWDEKETQSWCMGRIEQTGGVVEGFGDAIRNMEFQQNVESGGKNLGDYHVSLSDDEGNDVEFKSKETQSASKISNARRMARKAKETFIEDKAPKKKRTSGNNFGPSLDGIDQSFRTFVEGFNATFATMVNAMTTSIS
ncbi:hypothetical protein Tco_0880062 [Tanacetum coccineum]